MKKINKIILFIYILTYLFSQTACTASYYKIIKSDTPPASGRGNISGTVVSETDGNPLENVDVLLCRDVVILAGCSHQIGQTKTNQAGVYWFRNLPPGSYVPAIKQTENKIYVLQEQKRGEYIPKAILFNLEAGQTVRIEPQKVTIETQGGNESVLKLKFPINFETIAERKPKLTWEAVAGADEYFPFLVKVDVADGNQTEVKLESGTFRPVKTTSVSPLNDLEDGVYVWGIYIYDKAAGTSAGSQKAQEYFVVIGAAQSEK